MDTIKAITIPKWIIICVSLFLLFAHSLIPNFWGMNDIAMACFCIFCGTMLLLLFVDLTWPLFLCLLALSISEIYPLTTALANSLGSSSFWYFVLAAIVVSVLNESNLLEHLAYWFVSRRFAKRNPWIFLYTLFASTMLIGSITDPVAMIIVMCAFTEKILGALDVHKGDRFGESVMIGVLVAVGLSYGITPFAHAVPVVVINYFNESLAHINFFTYSVVGYAVGIVSLAVLVVLMRFVFRIDVSCLKNFDVSHVNFQLKPIDKRGWAACIIYLVTIFLWLFPGMIERALPGLYVILNGYLGTVGPLVFACVFMCTIPVDGRPLMALPDKLSTVPWKASFIAAVAPLLGGVLTNPDGSVVDALSTVLGPAMAALPTWLFVFLVCLLATVLTDFASDMTVAILVSVLVIGLVSSGAVTGVNPGAIAIGIGIGQGCAFATPAGSAYTAYASSTGWISRKHQLVQAGIMDVLIGAICGSFGYWLACAIV